MNDYHREEAKRMTKPEIRERLAELEDTLAECKREGYDDNQYLKLKIVYELELERRGKYGKPKRR